MKLSRSPKEFESDQYSPDKQILWKDFLKTLDSNTLRRIISLNSEELSAELVIKQSEQEYPFHHYSHAVKFKIFP